MLVKLSTGEHLNESYQRIEGVIAINPKDVSSVERARSDGWSVITMKGRREFLVVGTVDEIITKLNLED